MTTRRAASLWLLACLAAGALMLSPGRAWSAPSWSPAQDMPGSCSSGDNWNDRLLGGPDDTITAVDCDGESGSRVQRISADGSVAPVGGVELEPIAKQASAITGDGTVEVATATTAPGGATATVNTVYLQRISPTGVAGPRQVVASEEREIPQRPRIALAPNGSGAIIWPVHTASSGYELRGTRLHSDGSIGPAEPLVTGVEGASVELAATSDGTVFVSYSAPETFVRSLLRWPPSGGPATPQMLTEGKSMVRLAADGSGDLSAAVLEYEHQDFTEPGDPWLPTTLRLMRLSGADSSVLGESLIYEWPNPGVPYQMRPEDIELASSADGRAIVAWASNQRLGSGCEFKKQVWIQAVDAMAIPIGDEQELWSGTNSTCWDTEIAPRVAVDSSGSATVLWSEWTGAAPIPVYAARLPLDNPDERSTTILSADSNCLCGYAESLTTTPDGATTALWETIDGEEVHGAQFSRFGEAKSAPPEGEPVPEPASNPVVAPSNTDPQSGSGGKPIDSPPTAATRCPTIKLIGVRGSGEPQGLGRPVGAFSRALGRRLHLRPNDGAFGVDPLLYPAKPVDFKHAGNLGPIDFEKVMFGSPYKHSVATGVRHLLATLRADPCRHASRYILAGYSQGAEVVGNVLATGLPKRIRRHIEAVVFFGDPRYNSWDRSLERFGLRNARYRQGILGRRKRGAIKGAHRDFPVLTYCTRHADYMCGYNRQEPPILLELPGRGHLHYAGHAARNAALRVARLLRHHTLTSSAKLSQAFG
ncbi:MAG: cutinase family protein [Gammaproteobacteria bacterium]